MASAEDLHAVRRARRAGCEDHAGFFRLRLLRKLGHGEWVASVRRWGYVSAGILARGFRAG